MYDIQNVILLVVFIQLFCIDNQLNIENYVINTFGLYLLIHTNVRVIIK